MRWIRGSMFALALLIGVLAGTAHAALNAYLRLGPAGAIQRSDTLRDEVVLFVKMDGAQGVPMGRHDALLASNRAAFDKDTQLTFHSPQIYVIVASQAELSRAGFKPVEDDGAHAQKVSINFRGPAPGRPNFITVDIDK
jgi:hypothetical protein